MAYMALFAFVLAGAVNAGFSRFYMAIPFMLLLISISIPKGRKISVITIAIVILSIGINKTQESNPILFPILAGGYVQILEDGYLRTFSDGSGGFSKENKLSIGCATCGEVTYQKLKKGEKYKVLKTKIKNPDFGITINLVTEIGEFHESNYKPWGDQAPSIKISKPARAKWAEKISSLMAWPIFFFLN